MAATPLGFTDPRKVKGELLFPALFNEERTSKLETQLRATMGEFGVAGQCQQRPVPEAGGLFQETWLPIVEAAPAQAQVKKKARGWDCAGTAGGGDYSVGVLMSLTHDGIIYVEDVVRDQWGPDQFEGELGILKSTVVGDGRAVAQREEQEPGSSGKKVIAEHARLLHGHTYSGKTSTGDKVTRARPFRNQASVGNVRLVRGPWNRDYKRELCAFPNGTYDDQVDASSSAYDEVTTQEKVRQSVVWGR
jgi:predicted phage terminase large subunit-like protein